MTTYTNLTQLQTDEFAKREYTRVFSQLCQMAGAVTDEEREQMKTFYEDVVNKGIRFGYGEDVVVGTRLRTEDTPDEDGIWVDLYCIDDDTDIREKRGSANLTMLKVKREQKQMEPEEFEKLQTAVDQNLVVVSTAGVITPVTIDNTGTNLKEIMDGGNTTRALHKPFKSVVNNGKGIEIIRGNSHLMDTYFDDYPILVTFDQEKRLVKMDENHIKALHYPKGVPDTTPFDSISTYLANDNRITYSVDYNNTRTVVWDDSFRSDTFSIMVGSKFQKLYNVMDVNQPVWVYRYTRDETLHVRFVFASFQAEELESYDKQMLRDNDLRQIIRTMALNSRNVMYQTKFGQDPGVHRFPANIEIVVFNRPASARLQQLLNGTRVSQVPTDAFQDIYEDITLNRKQISFNDTQYATDEIKYRGQKVSATLDGKPVDIYALLSDGQNGVEYMYSSGLHGQPFNEVTFDNVMHDFPVYATNWYHNYAAVKDTQVFTIRLGDVDATILKLDDKPWKINNIRINKADLVSALRQAFMYTNQKDYDEYLRAVSRMSLPMRNMVKQGITIHVTMTDSGYRGEDVEQGFLFKFKEVKRRPVLDSKHGEFGLRNALYIYNRQGNSLVNLGEFAYRLTKEEDPMLVAALMQEAHENFQKRVVVQKKNLERAVQITGAEKTVCVMPDESEIEGYKLDGALDEYFLSTEYSTYGNVYRYKTGEYICMVDKDEYETPEQQFVARLFVLNNDNVLAGQIDTL